MENDTDPKSEPSEIDTPKTTPERKFSTLLMKKISNIFSFLSLSVVIIISLAIFIWIATLTGIKVNKNPLMNPVSTLPKNLELSINSPEDDIIVFEKTALISGKSSPGAVIIISSGSDQTFKVDANLEFSKDIALTPGLNLVDIFAFDEAGNTKQLQKRIFYSETAL